VLSPGGAAAPPSYPDPTLDRAAYARIDTLNVHAEHSRLAAAQLARWRGLPVEWIDAGRTVHSRNFLVPRPLVALLDTGVAHARFDFGSGVRTYELTAGALRVFDGRRACRLNDWACRSARRIIVHLDAGRFGEPELLAGLRQDLDFRDDGLAGVLRAMVREIAEGCPHGALYGESLSSGVLQRLAATHGRAARERGRLSPARLRRVDELVAQAPDGGPTLAEMAAAAGYSRAQFVRLFRLATGMSPHRYVLRRRLERARRLVVDSLLPLAQVASETGFASQSHFSNAFVREFGATPGQARRDARH
jgi:AraC family transcriptional regulator